MSVVLEPGSEGMGLRGLQGNWGSAGGGYITITFVKMVSLFFDVALFLVFIEFVVILLLFYVLVF